MDLYRFVARSTLKLSDVDGSVAAIGSKFKFVVMRKVKYNTSIEDKLMSALFQRPMNPDSWTNAGNGRLPRSRSKSPVFCRS